MKTQNQIKRTLSQPEAIKQINNILDANTNINRSKLADLICDQFNFFNPCGEKQRSGCLKALRKLEQNNFFVLPVPCKTGSTKKVRVVLKNLYLTHKEYRMMSKKYVN